MQHKIHVFENKDKGPIQEDHDMDNLLNYKRGFRALYIGLPNSGKTNVIFNTILNQRPIFDRVILVPLDRSTKEYDHVNAQICEVDDLVKEGMPKYDAEKILIVLEDIAFSDWSRKQMNEIGKYLRYQCSHNGTSLIISLQNMFSCPPSIRRLCTHITLFKTPSRKTASLYSQSIDLDHDIFNKLCNKYLETQYNHITIANDGHPIKLRLNSFNEIDLKKII